MALYRLLLIYFWQLTSDGTVAPILDIPSHTPFFRDLFNFKHLHAVLMEEALQKLPMSGWKHKTSSSPNNMESTLLPGTIAQ